MASRRCQAPARHAPRWAPFAFALAALVVGGCNRGCRGDRPYVPYAVGEGGAPPAPVTEDATVEEAAAEADAGVFQAVAAELAPPDAARWTLGPDEVVAPEGSVLVAAITGDFDGDGARDVAAWARRTADADLRARSSLDAGSLLHYRGKVGGGLEAPSVVATAPALAADCTPALRYERTGVRTAFVELRAECTKSPRPPRWIAVASLAPARLRLSATVTDPPGAPPLTFEADGTDVDRDGAEDVTLRASVEGGAAPFEPGPRVSALLRWFDRPAGLSRDVTEPDASLKTVAAFGWSRAGKPKDAPFVPVLVQSVRFLYSAICAEGGAPRLREVLGADGVPCGSSRALEDAGLAEARAFATGGDALRALLALERAQKPPATTTAARTKELLAILDKVAPPSTSRGIRELSLPLSAERGRAPVWGPVAFERAGTLLVRTTPNVVRFDPATNEERPADDVQPWKGTVLSPEAEHRWIDAYNPCNGPAVHLTFAPTGEGDMHDLAAPVLVPLQARCVRAKGEAVPAVPIAWGPRGLEALVAGEPLLVAPDFSRASPLAAFLDQPGGFGSPRSPSGRWLVLPTVHGLVLKGERTRILRAKELDGTYAELRGCTVNDDGRLVACVRRGRVVVGEWDAP